MKLQTPLAVIAIGTLIAFPPNAVRGQAADSRADSRAVAPYGSTLTFGTGLVTIPVAWASPATGDMFASASARAIGVGASGFQVVGSLWDMTQSLELHAAGRATVGYSVYGADQQQVGFSGQFVLVKQPQFGQRWIPSLAIGARNVGSSAYQDRFVTGGRRAGDVFGDSAVSGERGVFNASPTLYGVATREFEFKASSASITVGYGNGLFKETGALDTIYSRSGTVASGLFFGFRLSTLETANGRLSVMVENNGFDWNAGANFSVGHLSFGVFLTEIEERKGLAANGALANYTKAALSLSYTASLADVVRSSMRRAEASEAALELRRLAQEIAQRRVITARLVAELNNAMQAADAAAVRDQQDLMRRLNAERDALKGAQKRLEELQKRPPDPESDQ